MWITLRTAGFIVTAPVIGTRYVPGLVKAAVSLLLGFILWPTIPAATIPVTAGGFVASALGEVSFGLFLGFAGTIIMAAIETAGHVVDMKIGFGMANVVDPHYGQASPILGILKYLLIILVFLSIDGHHMLLKALFKSFEMVPVGTAVIPQKWAYMGVNAASKMLRIALALSCPVWAATMIVDFALGVIARTVPQLNVFVVGIPLKTIVGLSILSASVTFYGVFTKRLTLSIYDLLENLLGVVGK